MGQIADLSCATMGITAQRQSEGPCDSKDNQKRRVKKSTLYNVALAGCILALVATFIFPDTFEFYRTLKSFHAENIRYNSADPAKQVYRRLEDAHGSLRSFELSMTFKPTSLDGYSNAFQTAPANSGLRLELAKPSLAAIIAAAKNSTGYLVIVATDALSLGNWHTFFLRADPRNHVTVIVDGQTTVDETYPELSYDISDVEIGQGFSQAPRPFSGQIKNASISYRLLSGGDTVPFRVLFVVGALVALSLSGGVRKRAGSGEAGAERSNSDADGPQRRFRGDEA